ncbi:hypothetical protein JCM19052_1872 [Vibrio sp. JCM 19052]|nr:hypothetical protein JCM19052_1872 [Vibrio sp. JCM 19052]
MRAEDKPFAYYVEQALAAYVGRVDMSLEVFSELIGISKRTVQRSLKQEAPVSRGKRGAQLYLCQTRFDSKKQCRWRYCCALGIR